MGVLATLVLKAIYNCHANERSEYPGAAALQIYQSTKREARLNKRAAPIC